MVHNLKRCTTMLNWIKKNIICKIRLRREVNAPQSTALETTQQKQIESDKPKSRLAVLHHYNDIISPLLLYSTIPELPEDVWRLIISNLLLGGLFAVPFVSKLFNKIWKNIIVENAPAMAQIFGDNARYSKLSYRRKLVSGFGMLSLLERSLQLLHVKDYDNLLLVVQKILRYSSMLFSVAPYIPLIKNALDDYHRVFYYDMSLNNKLVALWGTDSETHSKSWDVKYALFGKDGHYIDVEYKYNLDQYSMRTIQKHHFKINLKSLNDENECQEISFCVANVSCDLRTYYHPWPIEFQKIGDWLGGDYNESPYEGSIYKIIYDYAVHPEPLKTIADRMTLEQVFQYAIRVLLKCNTDWQYELNTMALQAFARLTTLSRIKKYKKTPLTMAKTNDGDHALSQDEDEDIVEPVVLGRKRKIDQISNTELINNSERPTKRLKLDFDTCHPISSDVADPYDKEVTELFLNADFINWRSDARVFYVEIEREEENNDGSFESKFYPQVQVGDLLRQDRLEFNLYSKDKSKTVHLKLKVEEYFNSNEMEMQNDFDIHIQVADQEFHISGYESDSIEDVIKDVDQVVIDTLQLEHINTKQFASLLCAICDQHENTEVMKIIRAKRNNSNEDTDE